MGGLMTSSTGETGRAQVPKLKKWLTMLVAGGVLTILATSVYASAASAQLPTSSAQTCYGSWSTSNGAWSFAAGAAVFPPSGVNSNCSFDTNESPAADFQYESVTASTLNLNASGTFNCATGGTGSLASPSLSSEVASPNEDLFYTGVGGYSGYDPYAYIVWNASLTRGVGTLKGTLYGALAPGSLDAGATSTEPVSGQIVVSCNGPAEAATVLTFPSTPPTPNH